MPRLFKNPSSQSSTASKRYEKSTTSSTTTTNFFKSTLVIWWARARLQRREAEERNKPAFTTTSHLHVALVTLTNWSCAWIKHHLKYMNAKRRLLISTATYNDKTVFGPSFLKQRPKFWAISIYRATERLWRLQLFFSFPFLEHWISKGAAPSPPFWRKKRRGAHDTQTLNNNFSCILPPRSTCFFFTDILILAVTATPCSRQSDIYCTLPLKYGDSEQRSWAPTPFMAASRHCMGRLICDFLSLFSQLLVIV